MLLSHSWDSLKTLCQIKVKLDVMSVPYCSTFLWHEEFENTVFQEKFVAVAVNTSSSCHPRFHDTSVCSYVCTCPRSRPLARLV